MNNILHEETTMDSLFDDYEQNLNDIYSLWNEGDKSLKFIIPILCAVKLEAFINVAGKLKLVHWDILERKLSFEEKCKMIFSSVGLEFNRDDEPNKTAVEMFNIRNALVHPKMKLIQISEYISPEEHERRNSSVDIKQHHLRKELTKEKLQSLKEASDEFISQWKQKLLNNDADYWLSSGSSWSFSHE